MNNRHNVIWGIWWLLLTFLTACGEPVAPRQEQTGWQKLSRACGIYADSAVYCLQWTAGSFLPTFPVTTDLKAIDLSSGFGHACIITAARQVACWGSNAFGQLGDGTTTNRATPVLVASNRNFQQVSANANHTCAVSTDGSLHCWGANGSGQLGFSPSEQCSDVPCSTRPVQLTFSNRAVRVAAGGFDRLGAGAGGGGFTCAVDSSQELFCWGANEMGQLGIGSRIGSPSPVRVELSGVIDVAVGSAHTCATQGTGGRIYCWGYNGKGQVGVKGDATNLCGFGDVFFSCYTVPQQTAYSGFKEIEAFIESTCGIDSANRGYCWGSNDFEQLGPKSEIGNFTHLRQPVRVNQPIREIGLLSSAFCARLFDGSIACWGNGSLDVKKVEDPQGN